MCANCCLLLLQAKTQTGFDLSLFGVGCGRRTVCGFVSRCAVFCGGFAKFLNYYLVFLDCIQVLIPLRFEERRLDYQYLEKLADICGVLLPLLVPIPSRRSRLGRPRHENGK